MGQGDAEGFGGVATEGEGEWGAEGFVGSAVGLDALALAFAPAGIGTDAGGKTIAGLDAVFENGPSVPPAIGVTATAGVAEGVTAAVGRLVVEGSGLVGRRTKRSFEMRS